MKKVKAWDYLSSMPEIPGRDDLANAIITSLDYNLYASRFSYILFRENPRQGSVEYCQITSFSSEGQGSGAGQSRGLLAKFLTSNSKVVRYFATRHLRILLRSGVAGFSAWAIQLIMKQVWASVLDNFSDSSTSLSSFLVVNFFFFSMDDYYLRIILAFIIHVL
jgi:hypothetical protein